MIPILELRTQYSQIQEELEEAVLRVLRSTSYILGSEVKSFEEEFAAWNGVKYGIGVGNGTDAIQLAVRALELAPEDEVIVPSFTFVASAGAVALAGSKVVFADVDPVTFTLDPDSLEKAITPRTKAVVAVHLYGHAADMDRIAAICREHKLFLIEDCAQASGAQIGEKKVGGFGDMSCYSFFPSKNLGGIGDGGIVLTNNEKYDESIRMLRGHGSKVRYYHEILGTNSRLDEIQAAVLDVNALFIKGELQAEVCSKIAADFICLTALHVTDAQYVAMLGKIVPVLRKQNKFLFVFDRCDIAVISRADGVVLNPGAVSVRQARELLPAHCAVGVRVEEKTGVEQAFLDGADWILTPKRFPKCSMVQAVVKP